MASNINDSGINKDYPVAGQDNDSQGFRDNFNVIKDNFTAAKTEIETLQNTTAQGVSYEEDSNGNPTSNDFLGLTINGMNMQFNTEAHHPSAGTVNTSQNVNINNGPHQSVVVGADVTLNLTAWTTTNDKTNKVRIYVKTADTTRTITFSSNNGSGTIKTSTNWPTNNATASITPKDNAEDPDRVFVFEFFSFDQGATVWSDYIGQYD